MYKQGRNDCVDVPEAIMGADSVRPIDCALESHGFRSLKILDVFSVWVTGNTNREDMGQRRSGKKTGLAVPARARQKVLAGREETKDACAGPDSKDKERRDPRSQVDPSMMTLDIQSTGTNKCLFYHRP